MKDYIDENRVKTNSQLDYIAEVVVSEYYTELRERIEHMANKEDIINNNWDYPDINRLIEDVIKRVGKKLIT